MKWYTLQRRPGGSTSDPNPDPPDEEQAGGDGGAPDGAEPEEAEEEREKEKEEILPPPPALKALYSQRGEGETFFLAMGGWARGAIFECSWKVRNTRLTIHIAGVGSGSRRVYKNLSHALKILPDP